MLSFSSLAASEAPEVRFKRALELFEAGDYPRSRELLEGLVQQDDRKPLYWFNLAGAYFKQGQYDQALVAYRKVASLGSPLSEAARFFGAECQIKLGRFSDAKSELSKQGRRPLPPHLKEAVQSALLELSLQEHPQAQNALKAAMSAYQSKSYSETIRSLDTALKESPSGDAYFLKGLAHLRLHDPQSAVSAFEMARASPTLSADLQKDVLEMIRQVREGVWSLESSYSVMADFWVDYNSNVFDNGASETSAGEPVFHVGGTFRHRLGTLGPWSALGQYRLQWDEIADFPDFRLIHNAAKIQVSSDWGNWFVSVAPELQYEIQGVSSYLLSPLATLRAERSADQWASGIALQLQYNSALSDSFHYLQGYLTSARVYGSYYTGPSEYWALISITREKIGDLSLNGGTLPLANTNLGFGLGWTYRWPSIAGSLSVNYFKKNYDDLSEPGAIARRDDLWSGALTASYLLNPRLRPFASFTLNWNNSTLDSQAVADMNYRQWAIGCGLTWNALP